jgi:hypothetical protein
MTLERKKRKEERIIPLRRRHYNASYTPLGRQQRHSRNNKNMKTEADGSLIAVLPPSNMINTQYRPRASGAGLSASNLFHAWLQPCENFGGENAVSPVSHVCLYLYYMT